MTWRHSCGAHISVLGVMGDPARIWGWICGSRGDAGYGQKDAEIGAQACPSWGALRDALALGCGRLGAAVSVCMAAWAGERDKGGTALRVACAGRVVRKARTAGSRRRARRGRAERHWVAVVASGQWHPTAAALAEWLAHRHAHLLKESGYDLVGYAPVYGVIRVGGECTAVTRFWRTTDLARQHEGGGQAGKAQRTQGARNRHVDYIGSVGVLELRGGGRRDGDGQRAPPGAGVWDWLNEEDDAAVVNDGEGGRRDRDGDRPQDGADRGQQADQQRDGHGESGGASERGDDRAAGRTPINITGTWNGTDTRICAQCQLERCRAGEGWRTCPCGAGGCGCSSVSRRYCGRPPDHWLLADDPRDPRRYCIGELCDAGDSGSEGDGARQWDWEDAFWHLNGCGPSGQEEERAASGADERGTVATGNAADEWTSITCETCHEWGCEACGRRNGVAARTASDAQGGHSAELAPQDDEARDDDRRCGLPMADIMTPAAAWQRRATMLASAQAQRTADRTVNHARRRRQVAEGTRLNRRRGAGTVSVASANITTAERLRHELKAAGDLSL